MQDQPKPHVDQTKALFHTINLILIEQNATVGVSVEAMLLLIAGIAEKHRHTAPYITQQLLGALDGIAQLLPPTAQCVVTSIPKTAMH